MSSPCFDTLLRYSLSYFDNYLIDAWSGRKVSGKRLTASKVLNRLEIIQVGLKHFTLHAQAHALALAGDLHQARVLQLFYMVGKRGGCDRLTRAHVRAQDAFRPAPTCCRI